MKISKNEKFMHIVAEAGVWSQAAKNKDFAKVKESSTMVRRMLSMLSDEEIYEFKKYLKQKSDEATIEIEKNNNSWNCAGGELMRACNIASYASDEIMTYSSILNETMICSQLHDKLVESDKNKRPRDLQTESVYQNLYKSISTRVSKLSEDERLRLKDYIKIKSDEAMAEIKKNDNSWNCKGGNLMKSCNLLSSVIELSKEKTAK